MKQLSLQLLDRSLSSTWWRTLAARFIKEGDSLEIRCWKEETEERSRASRYGAPSEEGYEIAFKGKVTPAFLSELLHDEPADKTIYNKMTSFFTVNAKRGPLFFCSAHYGSEIYIQGATDADAAFFAETLAPHGDCFSFSIEEDSAH